MVGSEKGPLYHSKKGKKACAGACIARPVILEQNHIGFADIYPAVQGKSEISLKFQADGQWPPLPHFNPILNFATAP
jgi:hypothetical protein